MKKSQKLGLKRHSIQELSPRTLRDIAGGGEGFVHFPVTKIDPPSCMCVPSPWAPEL